MSFLVFDALDLMRTLAHVGVTMTVLYGEVVFTDGKQRWATDARILEENDHR